MDQTMQPVNDKSVCLLPPSKSAAAELQRHLRRQITVQQNDKNLSIANLNGLIKQSRNADFKSIVLSADRSYLIEIAGKVLMHTAATRSNIEIIAFLFGLGFDINAQNNLGQTSLQLSILNSNFQAAQLLLSLDADILIEDNEGISTFQMCFQPESQVPEYVIVSLFERLKRTSLSAHQMADHIKKAGCSIHQVLLMKDAEVTRIILDLRNSMTEHESLALLEYAMNSNYPNNVKILLTHGPRSYERRNIFIDKVTKHNSEPEIKFYFERIVEWQILNQNFMRKVIETFAKGNEKNINMYLEIGIDEYLRKNFNLELFAELFGNNNINCINIVKNRQFNINGLGPTGRCAIHATVTYKNRESLIYLLENGANPNVKDFRGKTPLMTCFDEDVHELLLEAGADVQEIDNEGKTIVELYPSDPVVARLCMLEAKGLLNRKLKDSIKNNSRLYENNFKSHCRDLEWMKTCNVTESLTLIKLFFYEADELVFHFMKEATFKFILEVIRKHKLQPTYDSMLKKKLEKLRKLVKLHRSKAVEFLSNVMKITESDHPAIERIIDFLSYEDLLTFDNVYHKQ